MPPFCPACRTAIRLPDGELTPNPQSDYRCHVCRLDLRFDAVMQSMVIAPLQTEPVVTMPRQRQRITRAIQPKRGK